MINIFIFFLILALNDKEILGQALIFLVAGYETVSILISFFFYVMATQPTIHWGDSHFAHDPSGPKLLGVRINGLEGVSTSSIHVQVILSKERPNVSFWDNGKGRTLGKTNLVMLPE